jgi:hypothetical protein
MKSKSFQAGTITAGLALEINEKREGSRGKPKVNSTDIVVECSLTCGTAQVAKAELAK